MPFALCKIQVCILPVNARHRINIIRLLHPALNLKGINTRLNQFRKHINGTQILKAHQIPRLISLYLPGKAAWLGTLPPVAAPAADHAA